MSWDVRKETITCPCGKGKITQLKYDDDWRQSKEDLPVIECDNCKAKYIVEEKYFSSYKPKRGDCITYYLTPIGYPKYSGVSEKLRYGPLHHNIHEISFSSYLIENFSLSELQNAKKEIKEAGNSSKTYGKTKSIVKECKCFLNTIKSKIVVEEITKAVNSYSNYNGSYDQRIAVREQEEQERRKYDEEKEKHQILLNL